jgi:hypothetical protein
MNSYFLTILTAISICTIALVSCKQSTSKKEATESTENQANSASNQTESTEQKTKTTEAKRAPLKTLQEAAAYISTNFINAEETLWVADELNDNTGMNMALIMDIIFKKGYMPDGFDQKEGYRIYKYKKR